jgi:phage gp36-like protein
MYVDTDNVFRYLVGYQVTDSTTSDLVDDSIIDAQNEINKYLGDRYDVTSWDTLTSTPPMVSTLCKWLAAGYAIEACGRGGKESIARAKVLIDRAVSNLKSISSGELALVNSLGVEIVKTNDPAECLSTTEDYANTFGEDKALRWKVSKTKLDDLSSERRE